jgi:membrane-associated phospholipid phosphatase
VDEHAAVERRRIDAAAAGSGLAVLVACGLGARSGTVGPVERTVFEAINGLPDVLAAPMRAAQLLGVLAVGPIVAVIAIAFRRIRLGIAVLLVTVGKLAGERIVWELVQRERPGTTVPNAIVRGDTPTTGVSFVSGHVVLVTGIAWVVTPYLRGAWRWLPWSVVALVAFARVYLAAHNPLDVVGGLALGVTIGGVVNVIVGVPGDESAKVRPETVLRSSPV